MIFQKMPIFLKNISCKLLIKYDGERNQNRYTIKLLYNDLKRSGLGKDTDDPIFVMNEIAKSEKEFPLEEIIKVYGIISEEFIIPAISKYGRQSVISVKLEECEGQVYYSFYFQIEKSIKRVSSFNYQEALEIIFKK